jgi:hypothetical protein
VSQLVSRYLEEVTDIDHKAVWPWLHCDPLIPHLHLKPGDGILVQDSEQVRVRVSSQADGKRGLRARRVEVEPHGRHPLSPQVLAEAAGLQAQPLRENLQHLAGQLLHCSHVLLNSRAANIHHK